MDQPIIQEDNPNDPQPERLIAEPMEPEHKVKFEVQEVVKA